MIRAARPGMRGLQFPSTARSPVRYNFTMRLEVLVALSFVGCASGNTASPDSGGGPSDAYVMPDSGCGALPCEAIYVARSGSDSGAGTKLAPLKTISAAITKASASLPPLAVFVKSGTYPEPVTMKAGVSVYGGFDDAWMQNPAVTTAIASPSSPAVTFDAINAATVLAKVTVKSPDATTPGQSSFAVTITGSKLIELRDVTVLPGIGANGVDGGDGATGAPGGNGTSGNPGVEHSGALFCSNRALPASGGGGTSSCGRSGGGGGQPGVGGNGGSSGDTGAGGSPGGAGAPGESVDGTGGGNGYPGGNGGSAAGGVDVGVFVGSSYMPSNGTAATSGLPGNGGGGGGGGGGGTTSCDSSGSSGGGGGAGGCAGLGGTQGTGGGGSFGIVAVDSAIVVKSSVVTANHGGAGGRGGKGGVGGAGGAGGPAGAYGGADEQDDGGMGAAGGPGGRGGDGGHGGGGGGGPSASLVCLGTSSIAIPQSTVQGGTGGDGGASMGNPGMPGVSTRAIGCSFF